MLFSPVIKIEFELILLKFVVVVEFKLFIKLVFGEILLIFVLIKLELELLFIWFKLVVIIECKIFFKCAFDVILEKFVFEVIVRLPVTNACDETLTKLLAMVAVLFMMK